MSKSNPCGVEQSQETAVAPKHAATLRLHAVAAATALHLDHFRDSVPALGAGVLNPDHGAVSQNWKRLRVLVVPLLGFCRKRGGCLVNGVAQVAPLLLERARMCQHLRSKGPAEQQLGRAETVGARRVSELQEASAECIDVDVAIRRGFGQKGLDCFDCSLCSAVGLVVVGTADRVVDSPAVAKLLERLRGKLGAAVRSQLHRDALVRHPLFQKVHDLQ